MVKQYPHHLFAVFAGDSVQDEHGNWSEPEANSVLISVCREETDGRGSEIQVADGTFHRFSSLIQLPKGVTRVDAGTNVFVADSADGSGIRVSGSVLKFDAGQLHSRLWL